jgi:thiol-disulfide isomerase/thioredoxin
MAIEIGVVIAIVATVGFLRTRDHRRGELPALTLAALDGAPAALPSLREPTVVAFFAPWCGVCKLTAQNLRWAAGAGANVVSIATAYDDEAAVRAYVDEHRPPGRVLLDPSGAAAEAFGVQAFPTFYFVGRDGRVEGSTVGYTTTLGLLLRSWM